MNKLSGSKKLQIWNVVVWVIFIGLCINSGAYIFEFYHVSTIDGRNYGGFSDYGTLLSKLHSEGLSHYLKFGVLLAIVSVLKALLFYIIIKMLQSPHLLQGRPFVLDLLKRIRKTAYLAISIGLISYGVGLYYAFLIKILFNSNGSILGMDEAKVWIFLGVILLAVSQLVKSGIEIQSENELTI